MGEEQKTQHRMHIRNMQINQLQARRPPIMYMQHTHFFEKAQPRNKTRLFATATSADIKKTVAKVKMTKLWTSFIKFVPVFVMMLLSICIYYFQASKHCQLARHRSQSAVNYPVCIHLFIQAILVVHSITR